MRLESVFDSYAWTLRKMCATTGMSTIHITLPHRVESPVEAISGFLRPFLPPTVLNVWHSAATSNQFSVGAINSICALVAPLTSPALAPASLQPSSTYVLLRNSMAKHRPCAKPSCFVAILSVGFAHTPGVVF
jgi:hypothetical protein